jgi:hypothetical protein
MKPVWHNKNALQKTIVICTAVCVLSFGLCSAGLLTDALGSFRFNPFEVLGTFGNAAILSFAVALFLFAWNDYRSKRKL